MDALSSSSTLTSTRAPVADNSSVPAPTVLLIGNPNVGKTTLYNALTGQNERVGNYPGITVERRLGHVSNLEHGFDLIDVPGTYSLSARSLEEQIALDSALGFNGNEAPSLIVVLIDAGQLMRNLYLVLQLVEFQLPMLLALTMMDEAEPKPEPAQVGDLFGLPCVAVNPRSRAGLTELRAAITSALNAPRRGDVNVRYAAETQRDVDSVAMAFPAEFRRNVERDRALGAWALLSVEPDDELRIPDAVRKACEQVRQQAEEQDRDLDLSIIGERYAYIERALPKLFSSRPARAAQISWTERVDRVLLHPVYGFALFVCFMVLLFQSLFSWADPAISLIERGVSAVSDFVSAQLPDGFISDLLVQGVLGGVGNVVVFLPQIVLLFLFVSVLEDSGYMARVAYLMDRVLRGVGLHGKAFVPMLSGMACAVPAIMATRTMERRRDRLLTMMVVPLMTCSARLPVYALVIGALFPPSRVFGWIPTQALLLVAMYLFSTLTTLVAASVLGRSLIRGVHIPLILELPRYRWPSPWSTLRSVWLRARDFLVEAGTVILGFTVLLWFLLSYPKPSPEVLSAGRDEVTAAAEALVVHTPSETARELLKGNSSSGSAGSAPTGESSATKPASVTAAPAKVHPIEYSFAGRIGKALAPVTAPLGFDWKLTVGILGAFSAREVFVSTLGLVFGIEDESADPEPLRERMRAETRPDGKPAYPPLVGLSLMVFFALACQCMSTLAVVKRETRSWRWPLLLFTYMTVLAYIASFTVYQVGSLLGFAS